jgi:predicted PilT family ATPase
MRRTTIITALVVAAALLASFAPAASASGTTTRTATLRGSVSFPNATGSATSKVSSEERELEVEVQHIKVLAGKHVNIFVNGNKWASPLVSSLGAIHVDRSTQRGQSVPKISSGSTVRVRTLGGTLIAGGRF